MRQGWISDRAARQAFSLDPSDWKRAEELMAQEGFIRDGRKGWPLHGLGMAVRQIRMERSERCIGSPAFAATRSRSHRGLSDPTPQ